MESHIFSVKTRLGFSFEFSIASHNHAFFIQNVLAFSLQGVNVTQSAKEVFCKSQELLLESVYLSDS